MENDTTQAQIPSVVPAMKDIKPKFRISWTKFIIIISVLILLGAGGVYLNRRFGPKPITTTGAIIVPPPSDPADPYVQLDKLLDLGNVAADGFNIQKVSGSTEIAVFLDKPYDVSQTKFTAWLKANGFENIPTDKIVFFHNP